MHVFFKCDLNGGSFNQTARGLARKHESRSNSITAIKRLNRYITSRANNLSIQ